MDAAEEGNAEGPSAGSPSSTARALVAELEAMRLRIFMFLIKSAEEGAVTAAEEEEEEVVFSNTPSECVSEARRSISALPTIRPSNLEGVTAAEVFRDEVGEEDGEEEEVLFSLGLSLA